MNASDTQVLYLAGGFGSGWQDRVESALGNYEIVDPRTHGLDHPRDYTEWDLAAIRRCDVVLAYIEKDNPGGYALALEVGYAKALGRMIVLVEEHPNIRRHRSFNMVREVADFVFDNLPEALRSLSIDNNGEVSNRAIG